MSDDNDDDEGNTTESGSFSSRVVDEDGEGISSIMVSAQYGAISGIHNEYTDDDGWATFPIVEKVLGGGAILIHRVWVNDEEVVSDGFYPGDGMTMSFTVPK